MYSHHNILVRSRLTSKLLTLRVGVDRYPPNRNHTSPQRVLRAVHDTVIRLMIRSLFDLSIVHNERGMYGVSVVRLHTRTRLNNEDAGGNVLTPWCLSLFFSLIGRSAIVYI